MTTHSRSAARKVGASRIPISPSPVAISRKSSSTGISALWAVSDPVLADEALEDDPLALGILLGIGDRDGGDAEIVRVLLQPRLLLGIPGLRERGVVDPKRLADLTRLVVGRIDDVEPEDLILGQVA